MAGSWYKVVIVDYAETALEEILVLPFGTIIIELLCYRPQGDPSWKAFLFVIKYEHWSSDVFSQ